MMGHKKRNTKKEGARSRWIGSIVGQRTSAVAKMDSAPWFQNGFRPMIPPSRIQYSLQFNFHSSSGLPLFLLAYWSSVMASLQLQQFMWRLWGKCRTKFRYFRFCTLSQITEILLQSPISIQCYQSSCPCGWSQPWAASASASIKNFSWGTNYLAKSHQVLHKVIPFHLAASIQGWSWVPWSEAAPVQVPL